MIHLKQKKLVNVYINCSFKNTIITITDILGNVLINKSIKSLKLKTLKKNNLNNLQYLSFEICKFLKDKKFLYLKIYLKGIGLGRYNIIRFFIKKKMKILLIEDKTFLPFNGCRLKKKKRK